MNMENEANIRKDIKQFVLDNFLMGDTSAMLKDGESFLETGTIDSTGVLEIVTFLEEQFSMKVDDTDPENLDSVDSLVKYVGRKIHAA
jgi:acyl carrier protein